jgi:hypothetical protein
LLGASVSATQDRLDAMLMRFVLNRSRPRLCGEISEFIFHCRDTEHTQQFSARTILIRFFSALFALLW